MAMMLPVFAAKFFAKATALIQGVFRHRVSYISVHALGGAASQSQRLDLGNITADHVRFQFV